jgi:hypothetical protein
MYASKMAAQKKNGCAAMEEADKRADKKQNIEVGIEIYPKLKKQVILK